MKRNPGPYKKAFTFAVPVFLFIFLSSCSMTNTKWSDLKFWQSKQQMNTLNEKTIQKFVEKIRTRPGNSESHYRLAEYYQERGLYRKAISEYDKVLSIDPTYIKAYNGKGIALDQLGEHVQAMENFERAIALNAKLDYVWNNLCYSLLVQGKYQAAIESCQKALSLNQENKRIRNNMALAYAMAGQYDRAFKEFATVGNGNNLYPHLKMAAIYHDKAMFQKAAEQYSAVLAIDPESAVAKKGLESSTMLIKVAEAAAVQKHAEEAKAAEDAKIITPIAANKSNVMAVETDKARQQAEIAKKLYEKRSFDEAIRHYEQAIVYDPTLVSAYRELTAAKALTKIAAMPLTRNVLVVSPKKAVKNNLIAQVGIEISNGNGKRHMARDIGKYLKAKGFNVVRISNAKNFNQAKGSIYYQKEYRELADKIAERIPEISIMQEMTHRTRPNVKVKVVLGKNLIANRQAYRN